MSININDWTSRIKTTTCKRKCEKKRKIKIGANIYLILYVIYCTIYIINLSTLLCSLYTTKYPEGIIFFSLSFLIELNFRSIVLKKKPASDTYYYERDFKRKRERDREIERETLLFRSDDTKDAHHLNFAFSIQ